MTRHRRLQASFRGGPAGGTVATINANKHGAYPRFLAVTVPDNPLENKVGTTQSRHKYRFVRSLSGIGYYEYAGQ